MGDALDELGRDHLGLAVRQGDERDVDAGEVGGGERDVLERRVRRGQRRVERADGGARVRVGGDVDDVELGMTGQEPEQLGPCVP